jgi:antitoxin (DNA-binding transcriptional repressor) of toxin-antitoxin stability system
MLFEVDVSEAPARFAEMMATIAAGYGVLIVKDGAIIARLAPEAAFAALSEATQLEAGLTPEEIEARELMALIEADMHDSF